MLVFVEAGDSISMPGGCSMWQVKNRGEVLLRVYAKLLSLEALFIAQSALQTGSRGEQRRG